MEIGNRLNQIFPRSVHCYVLHEQIWLALRCKSHCFQTANMWKFSAQILTTEAMYSVCVYHSHDPGRSLLSTNVTLVIMSSFTARCHASAVLAMGLYPCLRLCLSVSVCLSQVGILLKRQNVNHTNNTTRYLRDSSFLLPKISAKFDRGNPLRGRRMQVGWVKIGDFRQISGYISKTVKDRHIVSIKVE